MPEPFVLPADLQLSTADGLLVLRYPGDVTIDQDLGTDALDIEVGGNLEVRIPHVSGTLRAGGMLTVIGEIDGGSLHAKEIVLGDAMVECSAIQASQRIEIGAAALHVDVIIAPTIDIDPDAHGRVTVIESANERGPTKIKGGFSLQEYEELIGNAESFLAERGLEPLPGVPLAPPKAPAARSKGRKGATPPPAPPRTPPPAPPRQPPPPPPEDAFDEPSLSTEDLALEEVDVEPEEIDEGLQQSLQDAVDRIVGCYATGELPPPVVELQEIVAAGEHAKLRARITLVWNGLLAYHQKRGIRPHHQVTHAFNVIHGLLQPA